jgi:DNA-directed RNA polymerase subunit RPC12/RpoP
VPPSPCEFRAIAGAALADEWGYRGNAGKTRNKIDMSILKTKRPRKTTYERGVVACAKCAAPIYVYKLKALPDEFSVRCPRCGDRGLYAKGALRFESLPERRRKPRD